MKGEKRACVVRQVLFEVIANFQLRLVGSEMAALTETPPNGFLPDLGLVQDEIQAMPLPCPPSNLIFQESRVERTGSPYIVVR